MEMTNLIPGETIEKLMNINQWAPSTTPRWMYTFFKWLGREGQDAFATEATYNSPKLKEYLNKASKLTPLGELENLHGKEHEQKVIERYKRLKPIFEKAQPLEYKIREEAKQNFERKFEDFDGFLDIVKELLPKFTKEGYHHLIPPEYRKETFLQPEEAEQIVKNYHPHLRLIYDQLTNRLLNIGLF